MFGVWLWQVTATPEVWGPLTCVPAEILAGNELWTLLTAAFLHGSGLHLLGNLYFLWTFGDDVEEHFGSPAFLGWYGVWALAASLAFVVMAPLEEMGVAGLGASGAISGVTGAYLMLFPHRRIVVSVGGTWSRDLVAHVSAWVYFGFWIGFQLLCAAQGLPGVGWWAHIGGFAAGLLVAGIRRARSGG
jgi:membrane associated rhomboid family serine protease